MSKKEFEEKFFYDDIVDKDELWQWIEAHAKQARVDENEYWYKKKTEGMPLVTDPSEFTDRIKELNDTDN